MMTLISTSTEVIYIKKMGIVIIAIIDDITQTLMIYMIEDLHFHMVLNLAETIDSQN